MELNSEQLKTRLNSDKNIVNVLRRRRTGGLKGPGHREPLSDEVKSLIITNPSDSNREISSALSEIGIDVSHRTVGNLQKGLDVRGEKMDVTGNELRKVREDKIREGAEENLLSIIQSIKPRIAEEKKLKNLTSAAKDLASVMDKVIEKKIGDEAKVIIYAPQLHKHDHYEAIEVLVTT